MAVWTSIFALGVFATISKFSVFNPSTFGKSTASTFVGESRMSLTLRADIPYVGWLLVCAAALMIGGIFAFASYFSKNDDKMRVFGNRLMQAALVVQAVGIGVLVYQIKTIQNVVDHISTAQYERFAVWMLQQEDVPAAQISSMGSPQ